MTKSLKGGQLVTYTEKLSEFLVSLRYDSLSPTVIKDAKDCILDTLGCIIAGATAKEVPRIVSCLLEDSPQNQATVVGFGNKTSIFTASLLNGMMGHVMEMDDVHKRAKSHAGTVVIPAALSYGEFRNASGKDFILSVIVGYEVVLRIGAAINAIEHRKRGWHATSTCGTFGAAAAIAKMADLSVDEFTSALGLAGTQSSGLWAFTADGANCKMFHSGHAASCGYMSVKLAMSGLRGSSQIIEAKDGGFFAASSNQYNMDLITENLGEPLYISQMTRKPFACCRSMHPPIEASLKIKEHGINIEDIKQIRVKTYEVAKIQCGFTSRPQNTSDAKFSMPYGIAVALLDGHALMDQFGENRIKDEQVLQLADKVEIEADPYFSNLYPNQWGCKVEIELNNGEIFAEIVEDAKGDPVNPLTTEEIEKKFLYLSENVLDHNQANLVIEMVRSLEDLDDIGSLINLCMYSNKMI